MTFVHDNQKIKSHSSHKSFLGYYDYDYGQLKMHHTKTGKKAEKIDLSFQFTS